MQQEKLSESAQIRGAQADSCAKAEGPVGVMRKTNIERAADTFSSRPLNTYQLEQIEMIKANAAMLLASIENADWQSTMITHTSSGEVYECNRNAKKALEEAVMWAVKGISRQGRRH